MMILGGYWVPLTALRKFAKNLDMDLSEDGVPFTGNHARYSNNWLCDNKPDNIPNIKAAGIDWPPRSMQFGVIFISKFVVKEYFVQLEEDRDGGEGVATAWGGADQIQWATLEDSRGITANGNRPEKCTYTYVLMNTIP